MKFLAVIPARGGSKGIPRKNLYPLAGKPLIQYTLEAASESHRLDYILLSSDDQEIIEFCQSFEGVDCDYKRPAPLGSDTTPMVDTVIHGVEWLQNKKNIMADYIMILQPTSPLRTAGDIDVAIEQCQQENLDSLVSVNEMIEHPYECLYPLEKGWSYLRKPDISVSRRQDYRESFFYINGAIYIRKTTSLCQDKQLIDHGKSSIYTMPFKRSIDIDSLDNLAFAEAILRQRETTKREQR